MFKNVIPMKDQIKLFSEYRARLYSIAGPDRGAEIITKALFIVCAGTDDLANTYFTTPFRRNYDVPSYINLLVSSASEFIRVHACLSNLLRIYIACLRSYI